MSIKRAKPDHAIHELIASRFSPYTFAARAVAEGDLRSLFEAARWAPSSYNEQPWSYIVATRDDVEAFEQVLSCLFEANQAWARHAPVLALGVLRTTFARNDQPNPACEHDLGAASAHLTAEATSRGLAVHQMSGILPDRARELFEIPEHSKALTALAIGYAGAPESGESPYRERDETPRERKPLGDFVFRGKHGSRHPSFG